jgi:hypothetical protein
MKTNNLQLQFEKICRLSKISAFEWQLKTSSLKAQPADLLVISDNSLLLEDNVWYTL